MSAITYKDIKEAIEQLPKEFLNDPIMIERKGKRNNLTIYYASRILCFDDGTYFSIEIED